MIEKQNTVCDTSSSDDVIVTLSENFDDDMEGIRNAFPQCEEDKVHEFICTFSEEIPKLITER